MPIKVPAHGYLHQNKNLRVITLAAFLASKVTK